MREKKVTAGDWCIISEYGQTWIESATAGPICMINGRAEYAELTEREKADANLISAAKELLKAFEDMFAMFAEEVADAEYCGEYRQAQTAIAKAYGETS